MTQPAVNFADDPLWWRGAIIYQIYPRSFQDSNGDGIGDLAGIVNRLPYIASLGVDAIWISPFYTSPMKDFGYDVSDFKGIDPIFGTLADFDAVVEKAHQLGLRVLIDQVLSHSSDQHPWFIESRANRTNPRAEWYVWADPKDDGTPPNNWLSVFGGSAWQWDSRRQQYYLHNFLVEQPDLNFHNPQVQDALLDICRFWLDRGVDGFRLDVINFYFHDQELRDNPALPLHQRNSTIAPSVNPYNYQDHIYSKNRPENLHFLARLRNLMNEYPATTLMGEVGDSRYGVQILGNYTRSDDHVHMCYGFELLSGDSLSATQLASVMTEYADKAADGWVCWAYSNHDVERHASRWQLSPAALRMYTSLIMCLRGSICLYQGEELGLEEAEISYQDLQDPYGIAFWPEFRGRDGCRTPMVWDSGAANAGFSSAKSWLPVSPRHLYKSVDLQQQDSTALLHHYRNAIAFRKSHPILINGEQSRISTCGNIASFTRSLGKQQIFCAFNMSDSHSSIDMPIGRWAQIGVELASTAPPDKGELHLGPWQICLANKL